ncbi:hypothetical protein [Pseudonocardia xinjiangensis]|uniref:DUF2786 domain-containing protein n=1 Tax=Pseudonocardia xinjiangensis TaxID=75289 RepID=A0ABX1RI09_9PSEU|nr:hypothetical protein [Pseudonocardia xinjiangensis]NMH80025.1 hypothetical protein [Pseudonocardia xinjiangensis]
MPRVRPGQSAAFAEGRRLREAAETRRGRRRHGSGHGRRGPHLRSPWLFLIAVPVVAGGAGALVMTMAIISLVLLGVAIVAGSAPMLVAGTLAFVAVHRNRRHAALRRHSAAPAPQPVRPAPRHDVVWGQARARFHGLRSQYAAFECDPMEVLRLPALADVSVPSTARFVDAFAEAQALDTDRFPPPQHAAAFVAAVDRAERAWQAAREAAQRIRLSGLSAAERGTVERVIKLLTTARDSDSDPERLAAYARARAELGKLDRAGVIHLPVSAGAALDAAARGALPA